MGRLGAWCERDFRRVSSAVNSRWSNGRCRSARWRPSIPTRRSSRGTLPAAPRRAAAAEPHRLARSRHHHNDDGRALPALSAPSSSTRSPVAPCAGVAELQPGVDRHVVQHEAIVAHARALDLLSPDFTVVDFERRLGQAVAGGARGGGRRRVRAHRPQGAERRRRRGLRAAVRRRRVADGGRHRARDARRHAYGRRLRRRLEPPCGAALDVALRRAVEAWHLPDPAPRGGWWACSPRRAATTSARWETYAGRDVFGAWGLGDLEFGLAFRWSRSGAAPRQGRRDARARGARGGAPRRLARRRRALRPPLPPAARHRARCYGCSATAARGLANHVPFSVTDPVNVAISAVRRCSRFWTVRVES